MNSVIEQSSVVATEAVSTNLNPAMLIVGGQSKAKPKPQVFSDPFAEVSYGPVDVAGVTMATKVAVRVKADDGDWAREPFIVSNGYNIYRNSLVKDVGNDIMSRSNMAWNPLKRMWDGKMFRDLYITRDRVEQVGDEHPLHVGVMLRNAYDGSGAFGVEIFACNMNCANQFHDKNRFGYFVVRHVGSEVFDIEDALSRLSEGVQRVIAAAPMIRYLQTVPLTAKHIIDARQKTEIPSSKWASVLDQLHKEPGTLWGLFQSLTFVATHELSGMNKFSIGESICKHMIPTSLPEIAA